jgi:predicted transposase/invertase (TIGR01784 family)
MNSKKNQKPTNTKRNKKMLYEKIYDKYIDPFTDFGFKRLFGEEYNKDLLLDFLNELLYEEQGHIVSISYLNSEKLGISNTSRRAYYDLYCQNEKGEKFIVEIQQADQTYFKDRALFYSTFPIVEQAPKKKKWDYQLKAVYVIAILDFVFEEDKHNLNKYRYDIKLSDIETHKVFYDKLTFIYLEVPKFNKKIEELETRFEKWMYVIKNLQCLDHFPDELREFIFEKLFAEAEIAKLTPTEYLDYVNSIKNYRDIKNIKDTAEAKGLAKGLAKGRAEGLIEGRAKGVAEGLKQSEAKIVINAHYAGFQIDTITAFTGLTPEQITEIIKQ